MGRRGDPETTPHNCLRLIFDLRAKILEEGKDITATHAAGAVFTDKA